MFLGFYMISLDTRPDLSDSEPRTDRTTDDAVLTGWPALRQPVYPSGSSHPENPVPKDGTAVIMLGYMMDGYDFVKDGTPVTMFILMPGAGHILHAAHRDPDEMVEVWPGRGTVVFKSRELVWVSGTFERLTLQSREEHALYALRNASVAPGTYLDIANWFAQ